jgi:outer membrane protein assembly factor BamD
VRFTGLRGARTEWGFRVREAKAKPDKNRQPDRDSMMTRQHWMIRRASTLIQAVLLVGAVSLAGCASSKDAAKVLNPDPPGLMYAQADAMMAKARYEDAAVKFEDLDRDHPYAPEARRAMVMAAFAYYKAGKNPEAISAARRYTTLHPGTKDAALAHHVVASAYFSDIKDPAHDQTAARRALTELKIITTRYPESPYARQAENRIRICEDSIAASEMVIGRYYQKQRNQVAAINRFKVVVAEYQTTQHVEEALMRLSESYLALGVQQEAQSATAVLGHNFPQSRWYKDSYALLQSQGLKPQETSGSWISQQWKKIVPSSPSVAPTKAVPKDEPTLPPQPDLPQRIPSEDIPTASTTKSGRPMGLTSAN